MTHPLSDELRKFSANYEKHWGPCMGQAALFRKAADALDASETHLSTQAEAAGEADELDAMVARAAGIILTHQCTIANLQTERDELRLQLECAEAQAKRCREAFRACVRSIY